jgi:hypothetical protein
MYLPFVSVRSINFVKESGRGEIVQYWRYMIFLP